MHACVDDKLTCFLLKHLLQEMEQRFEQAKFWPSKSSVTLNKGSDAFELVPQDEPEKRGYSISPLSQETFKVYKPTTSKIFDRLCINPMYVYHYRFL